MRVSFRSTMGLVSALGWLSFAEAAPLKVALVLDKGGKDDKSFNTAAYQGAMTAKSKLGAEVKDVEATDDNAFETILRGFAKKDFDLIVAVGLAQAEAVSKVAPLFPAKRFAIVDAEVKAPNVRSLLFEEHEGSFLVGAIAGLETKSGTVGFVGGMEIPLIRRFLMGYEAGVKHVNPKAKVLANFVGVSSDAWNNPGKGKEQALAQYAQGADIVFAAAGASGLGVFDAAEEKKRFAIGVDSNQNWIKPGRILTSMLKRVDQAVFQTCKDVADGKFTAGVARYGLANEGIDFAMDKHNESLVKAATLTRVRELKRRILAKQLAVPDFYKK